jgi:V/A-type H+-transporting ATPase subunit E
MEDKIKILTEKLYEEGVLKARTEAARILEQANLEATKIREEAQQNATRILEKARRDIEALQKNTEGEIKTASRHAFHIVRQSITDMITLRTAGKWAASLHADTTFLNDIIVFAIQSIMEAEKDSTYKLVLPAELDVKVSRYLEENIHDLFKNQVVIDVSHTFESGFRIGPSSKNYIISFTEKDFDNFFKRLLRPKTIELLFQHVED